jgi:uncharacterized protein (TIGR03067 family)
MTDLERLQGTWRQTRGDSDYGEGMTTFAGTHFTVRDGDRITLEGDFVIDERAKTINWIDSIGLDAGKTLPAIYRLDDDHFTFVAANAGMARPTKFEPGPGEVMRAFVRA